MCTTFNPEILLKIRFLRERGLNCVFITPPSIFRVQDLVYVQLKFSQLVLLRLLISTQKSRKNFKALRCVLYFHFFLHVVREKKEKEEEHY